MKLTIDTTEFRELLENFRRAHPQLDSTDTAIDDSVSAIVAHIDAKIAKAVKESHKYVDRRTPDEIKYKDEDC